MNDWILAAVAACCIAWFLWREWRLRSQRLREAEKALRYYAEGNTDASGALARRHLEKWDYDQQGGQL